MDDFPFGFNSAVDLGRKWTQHELTTYNVTISPLPPAKFFLDPDPSFEHIDPAILGSLDYDNRIFPSIDVTRFLYSLHPAIKPTRQGFLVDFAAATLTFLGFEEDRGLVVSRLPFASGESHAVVRTDACLLNPYLNFALLVVIVDEILTGDTDAEPRVIAAAIAAFQFNNRNRKGLGLRPLDTMTIPCIKMTGTRPTFYLVPVTEALSRAITRGEHPAAQTRALRCRTAATTHAKRLSIGMEDIEYRKLALKRFLAFKALAKSHWERVFGGVEKV